jgi:hypothetical protein
MAIGVGLAVGYAVRVAGKGFGVSFRILAATLALAGCLIGNLLVACVLYAEARQLGIARVLETLDVALAMQLLQVTFSPMDLLFYGIAVWEAWRLAVLSPAISASRRSLRRRASHPCS